MADDYPTTYAEVLGMEKIIQRRLMWWYFKKEREDDNTVTYRYGFESKELSGSFVYDKKTDVTTIIKYAKNHSEKNQQIDPLPTYRLVKSYGAPDEKMIAIG